MGKLALESHGIYMTLRQGMDFEKELEVSKLKYGSFSRSQGRFEFPSGVYTMGPLLGKGSYGETLQAIHSTENTVFAVKILPISRSSPQQFIMNTIKESIINIILEKSSTNENEGPFVPRFHEIVMDPIRNLLLIRQERLHGTLADIYNASTKEQNDFNVPETLGDLAYVLNFFYKELQFNHRDLKSDNVMYSTSYSLAKNNKTLVKLIDFGFSCLTWNGVQIAGTHYFPIETRCFVPSRDLTQYIYEIWYSFRSRFSTNIQKLLQEILTFPTGSRMCKLFKGCSYRGTTVRGWGGELYDFLNLSNVENPKAVPSVLYRRMSQYMGRGSPKNITPLPPVQRTETGKIKHCLPEQIMNPKTRRCVRKSGAVGRRLLMQTELRSPSPKEATFFPKTKGKATTQKVRPCLSGKTRNPKTQRCRYRCPSSMIRNPKTQRCVSRFGQVGHRVVLEGAKTTPRSYIKP